MNLPDPWPERISAYLDGELDEAERAAFELHRAGCARCAALADDLVRLTRAARALPDRAPPRELWPALAAALAAEHSARVPRWVLAFAAGVALTLGGTWILPRLFAPHDEQLARSAESYLLLLHEPPGFGAQDSVAEHAAVVAQYSGWAEQLGARCAGGEELAHDGLELRAGVDEGVPLPARERVGGYFVLDVRDRAEALELARTCPHLARGGWLELRRIARR